MALLWVDGFEGYGTSDGSAPSPTGVVGRKYGVASESNMDIEAGRFGSGHCLELALSSWMRTPTLTTDDTLIVGVAFKATAGLAYVVNLYDDSVGGMNVIFSYGRLIVRRGSTELEIADIHLNEDAWYWIEFKVVCHNSTGSYELRVGEVNVASDSGIDTQAGSDVYHSRVMLGNSSSQYLNMVDDFYVCDGSGSDNNDFLGNMNVTTLFPDGAGTTTDFTASSGANYTCVDEQECNDDTDHVESSTASHKDTYEYDDVGSLVDIKGVQIDTMCRETSGSYSLITVIQSNSVDYDDSAQAIGTSSYTSLRRVAEQDPNTSAAWLAAAINSAEFGIKVG